MPTLRTLTITLTWCVIATTAACGSAPDAAVAPDVNEPLAALRGTKCSTKTTIALEVGADKRLTDQEAACLSFKSIAGARYLLAYVDTRLVNKAKTGSESPWPDSLTVRVEDASGEPLSLTATPTYAQGDGATPMAGLGVAGGASAFIPSSCPLSNSFYPHCRATPYTVGESITHYPGDGRPAGPAHVLTIGGSIVLATFDADAGLLAPNAKQRADSALEWIRKRNIPLLQHSFRLAKPTTTSDESNQLYVALQAPSGSSASWWPDAVNGHGRWATVKIGLSANSAFGAPGSSYTNALQILGHETMHTYQYRWRYEHAGPWQNALGTGWAIEGGAAFFAQEMIRERLGIPFLGNTHFGATGVTDPAFPLIAYGLRVRNFTFGYNDGASVLRDFVQRLVRAGVPFDDAMQYVLAGAMEGWYSINEEDQQHGLGLTRRMQRVLGTSWNPTDALLQWTMSEAADDLTSNKTYQNLTKRAFNPSTTSNNIRPDAVIVPGSAVAVSRAPGTTGVFEIDGSRGGTYRASSTTVRFLVASPLEWLLLRIQ
jgi:hypothetical protein